MTAPEATEPTDPATDVVPPEVGTDLPEALTEPTRRVGAGWITLLALANLGLWVGYFGPLQVLLPVQVEAIDETQKEALLALATGIGALVAMIANPVAGALSDRTTSRFGRRRPWAFAGALLGAAGLFLLSGRTTAAMVVIGWCVAQLGLNLLQAAITAAVPDQVPVRQRATVSGWIGVPQIFGVVVGVVLVTVVVTGNASGYVLVGAVVLALALPFVVRVPDAGLPREHVPAWSTRAWLRRFWVDPRQHPDFAWAFATRFLVQLGNAMATLYLLYYLSDELHYEELFPGQEAGDGLLVLILVYAVAAGISSVIGGVLSDRSGRRKRSVTVAGLIMAAPGVTMALFPVWPVVVGSALVLGIGYGAYMAVDQALVTQVLPTAGDRARDLGVVNIANSAPQVLGPVVAWPLVEFLGGYPALYLGVTVITTLGAVLVHKIRSVP